MSWLQNGNMMSVLDVVASFAVGASILMMVFELDICVQGRSQFKGRKKVKRFPHAVMLLMYAVIVLFGLQFLDYVEQVQRGPDVSTEETITDEQRNTKDEQVCCDGSIESDSCGGSLLGVLG